LGRWSLIPPRSHPRPCNTQDESLAPYQPNAIKNLTVISSKWQISIIFYSETPFTSPLRPIFLLLSVTTTCRGQIASLYTPRSIDRANPI
jgi:hypothetical protein